MPALAAIIIIFVALLVAAWIGRLVRGSCERARIDPTLTKFFAKMTRWLILIIAGLFCLERFGIRTASFAVVLGAAGLAIGLAFQGTLSNFAAGVMLLIFRPFKVGDVVNVSGEMGKVDEIELFTTTLDTPDNRRIILPNSSVFGATIENVTHHAVRRVDVAVGVDYAADVDQTREVLAHAAASVPGRDPEQEPQVVLTDLGDSSVNWQVRVWARTEDYWAVREATTRAIKLALDEASISIPFPQMDIHVDAPVPVAAAS